MTVCAVFFEHMTFANICMPQNMHECIIPEINKKTKKNKRIMKASFKK